MASGTGHNAAMFCTIVVHFFEMLVVLVVVRVVILEWATGGDESSIEIDVDIGGVGKLWFFIACNFFNATVKERRVAIQVIGVCDVGGNNNWFINQKSSFKSNQEQTQK